MGQEPGRRRVGREPGRCAGILGPLADLHVHAHADSRASAAAAASVSSLQVNAAWIPTSPRPPAERNRRFSPNPRTAPSWPWRSVTPYAHTTRTPTSAHASAITESDPSIALGDSWWSTIAVVPDLQHLQGGQLRRPCQHLQVQRGVEAPPDLFEDLPEGPRGHGRGRHAPGQRGVDVMVCADHSGVVPGSSSDIAITPPSASDTISVVQYLCSRAAVPRRRAVLPGHRAARPPSSTRSPPACWPADRPRR